MTNEPGRVGKPTGLSQAEPEEGLDPSGFDPSRDGFAAYVFADEVAGMLAMWAIRQSPYPCPDNLERVVARFQELWPAGEYGMTIWRDIDELEEEIRRACEQIPELLAWNEPRNGGSADFVFTSRYGRPEPDDDFIDLFALWRNVAHSIWDTHTHEAGLCRDSDGSPKGEDALAASSETTARAAESGIAPKDTP